MQQNDLHAKGLDLASAPWHGCEKGNILHETSLMFKRISPLMTQSGTEEFVTAEVIICKTCGKIPPFFASKMSDCPPELISECKK